MSTIECEEDGINRGASQLQFITKTAQKVDKLWPRHPQEESSTVTPNNESIKTPIFCCLRGFHHSEVYKYNMENYEVLTAG